MTQRPDLKQMWDQFVYGLRHPDDPSPTSGPTDPAGGRRPSEQVAEPSGGNSYTDEPAVGVENPYADESPHTFRNPYADPPPDPVEEAARRRRTFGRILQFFGGAMLALAVLATAVLVWNIAGGTADQIWATIVDILQRVVGGAVVLYIGHRLTEGKPILPNRSDAGPHAAAQRPSDPPGGTPPTAL